MRQEEQGSGQAPQLCAAEYVRMSTEHQQYSTENQADKIREYAARRGIEIVRTYRRRGQERPAHRRAGRAEAADRGRRGRAGRLPGHPRLRRQPLGPLPGRRRERLLRVHLPAAPASRSHYCAEQFENDGSPVSTIVKGVKRAMAGEYSRELSAKVFAGQCRLIELGYRQGGPPATACGACSSTRRGSLKGELARGEHKSIQTDRVILDARARGGGGRRQPDVPLVHRRRPDRIRDRRDASIAQKIRTDLGREWTRGHRSTRCSPTRSTSATTSTTASRSSSRRRAWPTRPTCGSRRKGAFDAIVPPDCSTRRKGSFGRARGVTPTRNCSTVCATSTRRMAICPASSSTKPTACRAPASTPTASAASSGPTRWSASPPTGITATSR